MIYTEWPTGNKSETNCLIAKAICIFLLAKIGKHLLILFTYLFPVSLCFNNIIVITAPVLPADCVTTGNGLKHGVHCGL